MRVAGLGALASHSGRAISWKPVGLMGMVGAAAVLVVGQLPAPAAVVEPVRALLMSSAAGAFVLALDDPAAALLDALPTSRLARLGHRLVLLAVAVVVVGIALVAIDASGVLGGPAGQLVAQWAALSGVALLVREVVRRRLPEAASMAGAAAVFVVTLLGVVEAGSEGIGEVLQLWVTHPVLCLGAAAAGLLVVDRDRR